MCTILFYDLSKRLLLLSRVWHSKGNSESRVARVLRCPTCDAEENATERDPAILFGHLEEFVDVVG